jgi:hypothetical protein
MDPRIKKELYLLRLFVVVDTLLLFILWFTGFTSVGQKQKFDEIDVERINIVEKNGQLRAVISNTDRMPDPIIDGKEFKTERVPGMIFYNGLGDECGGIIFGAVKGKDKYGAYGGFTFDQYRQSQAIGLVYNDHSGSRQVGLSVWDRPETSIIDLLQKKEIIEKMPDGPEKESEKKKLSEAEYSPTRIFVGKNKEKEAKVTLYDTKGNARINMMVDAKGFPHLDFLDENGKVIYSLPDTGNKSFKK